MKKVMASIIPRRMTISQIYNKSGLMYIRYDGKIEDRDYGQKQIAGRRQTYTMNSVNVNQ